jgi:dsRNA-specific ribonuclease
VLGDIVESLIGAVFLDSGGCLHTAWKAFKSLLQDDIKHILETANVSLVKLVLEMYPNRVTFEKRPSPKVC